MKPFLNEKQNLWNSLEHIMPDVNLFISRVKECDRMD